MVKLASVPVLSAAMALSVVAAGAAAQTTTMKLTCQNIGPTALESFGDQEGHSMRETPYACLVSGGPLDGGVVTARNWWDIRGTEWTLLLGGGVARHPGGFVLFHTLEGKLSVQMKDGKPAGYAANGRGRYLSGGGAGSQLAGRDYVWKVAPAGPTSFQADIEVASR